MVQTGVSADEGRYCAAAAWGRKGDSYVGPRNGESDPYVIGSGMMESTCKQLVSQRLEGTGMQASESGALAMTALVAHRINGPWDRFWTSRPLQRAAERPDSADAPDGKLQLV